MFFWRNFGFFSNWNHPCINCNLIEVQKRRTCYCSFAYTPNGKTYMRPRFWLHTKWKDAHATTLLVTHQMERRTCDRTFAYTPNGKTFMRPYFCLHTKWKDAHATALLLTHQMERRTCDRTFVYTPNRKTYMRLHFCLHTKCKDVRATALLLTHQMERRTCDCTFAYTKWKEVHATAFLLTHQWKDVFFRIKPIFLNIIIRLFNSWSTLFCSWAYFCKFHIFFKLDKHMSKA